jgi:hypothetical protein
MEARRSAGTNWSGKAVATGMFIFTVGLRPGHQLAPTVALCVDNDNATLCVVSLSQ